MAKNDIHISRRIVKVKNSCIKVTGQSPSAIKWVRCDTYRDIHIEEELDWTID